MAPLRRAVRSTALAAAVTSALAASQPGPALDHCALDGACAAGGVSLLQRQAAGAATSAEEAGRVRQHAFGEPAAQVADPAEEAPETAVQEPEAVTTSKCTAEDFANKKFDVVLYGATGFTGKLATKYLAKGHPESPSWAIAGHSKNKLQALKEEVLASSAAASSGPGVLVADLEDQESLEEMTRQAKSVVTYAGPYNTLHGENLIQAAIETCTHYVDLAGEAPWKVRMLQRFQAQAKARGVTVVQGAGLDSLPADLLAAGSAQQLSSDGKGPPNSVAVEFSTFKGWFSGGTAAAGADSAKEGGGTLDKETAYALSPETPEEARIDSTPAGVSGGYDADFSSMTVPYVMGFIDGPTVRRSLGLLYPGEPITFSEVMSANSMAEMAAFLASPDALKDPPSMNPQPGEGPPQWILEKGSMQAQGLAKRGEPNKAEARLNMACEGDPGYNATGKWSVELALGMAAGTTGGGFLTPSLAIGSEPLIERLSQADGGHLCRFWTGSAEPAEKTQPALK